MPTDPNVRPDVNHFTAAPDEDRDAVELVAARVLSFERGIGLDFKTNCEKWYLQYRGFKRFRTDWVKARGNENDRDEILIDAKQRWGANLHIPLSFRTIETMVPRSIAHRPKLLYLPRQERWASNVQAIRLLIDAQQENIDIDLPFQAVMRAGRIYGLGVGKSLWRQEHASRRRVQRKTFSRAFKVGQVQRDLVFDDPDFEDVDVFDFMWDPFGSDMRTCSWTVHRTWLGLDGILQRIRSGVWDTASAKLLTEEDIRRRGSSEKYDETWQMRMEASGFGHHSLSTRGEHIHEVWECHDGERVLTVLDRSVLVQDAESPLIGTMPFCVYRPTPLQKQMVGIGDLEPLEHLQRELDTLRSQRRDAATLALAAGYVFDESAVEREDLEFGPRAAIPVVNRSPAEAIMPIQVRDIPGSSYQEEQIIRTDFDAVSGISDALDPSAGGQISTATEAQLVQAALSRRIELGSRRFEVEVVRQVARAFLHLNQRMILKERELPVPDHQADGQEQQKTGRFRWFEISPEDLQGDYRIVPEGGSMAARNVPQDRQDASMIMQMFGQNPHVDPRRPLMRALELVGVQDPEAWLKQTDAPVPPLALQMLEQAGVDPQLIQMAVAGAQQADPRLPTEGPDQQQVEQMMGAQG